MSQKGFLKKPNWIIVLVLSFAFWLKSFKNYEKHGKGIETALQIDQKLEAEFQNQIRRSK